MLTSRLVDLIRPVSGSRPDGFVCLAPDDGHPRPAPAEVTKG